MKRITVVSPLAALGLVAAMCGPADALPPPPSAPLTLWNFLGIPQGFNKIRDASFNRRGNFPGLERKPPLKALADPSNLQSPVSAIKKAAEIKSEEDMAPQKIKAIKYLATVGCGCYGGVKEAMMEALEDCTEEVRYQTVLAIEDASTLHCETCNRDCCCDEELTKKLAEIAYEKNDKGCWLEPSERVREAAKSAMSACCPGQGPIGEDVPSVTPEPGIVPEGNVPTPPQVTPEGDRSARNGRTASPRVVSARRTKTDQPAGDVTVSDAMETEEVVTIDFGNSSQGGRITSARRGATSTTAAPTAKPASTKRTKPNGDKSSAPSSRRAAVERGLDSPTSGNRTANLKQPTNVTEKLQTPAEKNASTPAEVGRTAKVAYTSQVPARTTSLAPKSGPPAPAQTVDANCGRLVRGTVSRVKKDAGIVEVQLDDPREILRAGDRLRVTHEYLLEDSSIGYLEVVSRGAGRITARPVGELKLDKVNRGDEVTFDRARTSAPTAALPAPAQSMATR
jgi:hypothetical protein